MHHRSANSVCLQVLFALTPLPSFGVKYICLSINIFSVIYNLLFSILINLYEYVNLFHLVLLITLNFSVLALPNTLFCYVNFKDMIFIVQVT